MTAISTGESSSIAASVRPAIEDRPVGATPDNRKRRTLTSIVDVRNLDGSP
jgi:hypothetical protein